MKTNFGWIIDPLTGRRVLQEGKIWVGNENNVETPADMPDFDFNVRDLRARLFSLKRIVDYIRQSKLLIPYKNKYIPKAQVLSELNPAILKHRKGIVSEAISGQDYVDVKEFNGGNVCFIDPQADNAGHKFIRAGSVSAEDITTINNERNEHHTFIDEIKEVYETINNAYSEINRYVSNISNYIQQYSTDIFNHMDDIRQWITNITNLKNTIVNTINNMTTVYEYYDKDYKAIKVELSFQLDFLLNVIAIIMAFVGTSAIGVGVCGSITNINTNVSLLLRWKEEHTTYALEIKNTFAALFALYGEISTIITTISTIIQQHMTNITAYMTTLKNYFTSLTSLEQQITVIVNLMTTKYEFYDKDYLQFILQLKLQLAFIINVIDALIAFVGRDGQPAGVAAAIVAVNNNITTINNNIVAINNRIDDLVIVGGGGIAWALANDELYLDWE